MRLKFSELGIRALSVTEGQARYFDTATPGFGITIGKRTKTFIVVVGKSRKLTTIGKYPEISLADARKQAKRLLAQDAPKNSTTKLVDAVTAYLTDIQPTVRPKTYGEYARYLKDPPDIDLADLNRSHADTSPHSVMAWRIFCNWCMRNKLIDRNPFQFIKVEYGQRERVLTNDEIKQLWAYNYSPFSDYLKLLLLTGQRRSQFNDFEIRDNTLFFPARIMKGKRDHAIPLLPLARQYAENLQPFNGWSKGKARLDTKVLIPPWVVHDLRRTFSTNMAFLHIPIQVTEKILDHRTGSVSGVSAIYNRHSYLEEARQALLTYEAHIDNLTTA